MCFNEKKARKNPGLLILCEVKYEVKYLYKNKHFDTKYEMFIHY